MPIITNELINDLKRDEGCRLKAYKDTVGVWTIGYGHTKGVKENMVWSQEKCESTLREDAKIHADELVARLPWVKNLDQVRQDVLFNMAFNLGIERLLKFKNTLKEIELKNFEKAANMMLQSLWARQVKGRAIRLSNMMKSGRR